MPCTCRSIHSTCTVEPLYTIIPCTRRCKWHVHVGVYTAHVQWNYSNQDTLKWGDADKQLLMSQITPEIRTPRTLSSVSRVSELESIHICIHIHTFSLNPRPQCHEEWPGTHCMCLNAHVDHSTTSGNPICIVLRESLQLCTFKVAILPLLNQAYTLHVNKAKTTWRCTYIYSTVSTRPPFSPSLWAWDWG